MNTDQCIDYMHMNLHFGESAASPKGSSDALVILPLPYGFCSLLHIVLEASVTLQLVMKEDAMLSCSSVPMQRTIMSKP